MLSNAYARVGLNLTMMLFIGANSKLILGKLFLRVGLPVEEGGNRLTAQMDRQLASRPSLEGLGAFFVEATISNSGLSRRPLRSAQ
jgi:hypothetical protein